MSHKTSISGISLTEVVNWFQIVLLRDESQESDEWWTRIECCELISNCTFTWWVTSGFKWCRRINQLWIDFKLYFYVMSHKVGQDHFGEWIVVNWFQIVLLRDESQVPLKVCPTQNSCELISNCTFTWWVTSGLGVMGAATCCELISNCTFTWWVTSER